jgi:hypothetical protein
MKTIVQLFSRSSLSGWGCIRVAEKESGTALHYRHMASILPSQYH